ncbi:MAG: tRNA-dihydrouridine synthase [Bacillota bacterium]
MGLFSPIRVNQLLIPNRIVMPPMATYMATEEGAITQQVIQHYRDRASAGLVIVEHCYVRKQGRVNPRQIGIHSPEMLEGLRALARAVHEAGGRIAIQISHAGSATTQEVSGEQPVGPSDVVHPVRGKPDRPPRAFLEEELPALAQDYARAASMAREAGFDAVEIHGAHGYLLNQFTSPLTNHRTDVYGGSLENRWRFPIQVVRAVREAVGKDYPVIYRIGADDYMPGGITLEESVQAVSWLIEAGVDMLDVSGGLCGAYPDWAKEPGYFVPLARRIKQVAKVPVIGVGGISDPRFAEKLVAEGQVDLVAVGRAMLKDPDWVSKARVALAGQA